MSFTSTLGSPVRPMFQSSEKRPLEIPIFADNADDKHAFWISVGTFDMMLDISIAILPIYLLYSVHIPRSRKFTILSAFAARLL